MWSLSVEFGRRWNLNTHSALPSKTIIIHINTIYQYYTIFLSLLDLLFYFFILYGLSWYSSLFMVSFSFNFVDQQATNYTYQSSTSFTYIFIHFIFVTFIFNYSYNKSFICSQIRWNKLSYLKIALLYMYNLNSIIKIQQYNCIVF